MILKTWLMRQRSAAYNKNLNNILELTEVNPKAKLLDLGCDDGFFTLKVAQAIKTNRIEGLEIISKQAKLAIKSGLKVKIGDLNKRLPYSQNEFDVIHANQVIEHISDTDNFIDEIYRILKPGGYAIISTENLSSWHNVFALVLGYTPFSLTNISNKTASLGNPLDAHHGDSFAWEGPSWRHNKVFTLKGLIHLSELTRFKVEAVRGSGYYPFGNMLANFDQRHCAFITLKLRK